MPCDFAQWPVSRAHETNRSVGRVFACRERVGREPPLQSPCDPGVLLSNDGVGPEIDLGVDWQFVRGVALDLRVGTSFPINEFGVGIMFNPALGMRFRVLDDVQGYNNDAGGNLAGNLWAPSSAAPESASVSTSKSRTCSRSRGRCSWGPSFAPCSASAPSVSSAARRLVSRCTSVSGLGHDRGVGDERDKCPETPPNTEVDSRGCTVIPKAMVLDGITFKLNSADIEPASERTLQRALLGAARQPGSARRNRRPHRRPRHDRAQRGALPRACTIGDELVGASRHRERPTQREGLRRDEAQGEEHRRSVTHAQPPHRVHAA